MGEAFITRRGGGTALNFKVVGATEAPASPRENTIWVNTDTAITGWIFSAAEPAEPTEGLVWFLTSTSSEVAFNVLKKNGIMICPVSCKQYIGGAWAEKDAQSYIGGAWTEWYFGQLYYHGNEYTDITGGISVAAADYATVVKESDHIAFGSVSTNDTYAYAAAYANVAFDLTDKTTLKAIFNTAPRESTTGKVKLGIASKITRFSEVSAYNCDSEVTGKVTTDTGDLTLEYDISGVSGLYYVGLYNYINTTKLYALILE